VTFELGTDGPSTILAGVDGTPTSMRALSHALGLARRQSAVLVAVHVRPFPSGTSLEWDTSGDAAIAARDACDALERELRDEVAQLAEQWGVPFEFVVRRGDAVRELDAEARERRVDALVVGTSERLGHRIIGSTAVRLVRRTGWPVTVVP
jgi:nucleotide-binding universal stress UspA family protein